MSEEPCKICDTPTNSVFNINFKAVHICESCAVKIFLQQAKWYAEQKFNQQEDGE